MKKILSIAFAALIGFASCAKEDVTPGESSQDGNTIKTVTASMANPETRVNVTPGTGIGADNKDVATWKTGDQIAFYEVVPTPDTGTSGIYSKQKYDIEGSSGIRFALDGGEGTKQGTFTAVSTGLDPAKTYVCTTANRVTVDATVDQAKPAYKKVLKFSQAAATFNIASATDQSAVENNVIFFANVEFDALGAIKPLQFTNYSPILEFRIKKTADVAEFDLKSLSVNATSGTTNMFASYGEISIGENYLPVQGSLSSAATITMNTNYTALLDVNNEIVIRVAPYMRQETSSMTIKMTLTATDGREFIVPDKVLTAAAPETLFNWGKTYVTDIVVNTNPPTPISRAKWIGWAKSVYGNPSPTTARLPINAINGSSNSSIWHSEEKGSTQMPQWYLVDMTDATTFNKLYLQRGILSTGQPELKNVEYYITDKVPTMANAALTQEEIKAFVEEDPTMTNSPINSNWELIGKIDFGTDIKLNQSITYDLATPATSRFILIWMPTSIRSNGACKISDFQIFK